MMVFFGLDLNDWMMGMTSPKRREGCPQKMMDGKGVRMEGSWDVDCEGEGLMEEERSDIKEE